MTLVSYHPDWKGHISVQHTVWCGVCNRWEQHDGPKKECVDEWKREGWRRSRKFGWVCPACRRRGVSPGKLR